MIDLTVSGGPPKQAIALALELERKLGWRALRNIEVHVNYGKED